jgi:hypothetical protein
MSYVLRSWSCLNRRCRHEFDSGEPAPDCPKCGNVRVSYVPGGGHVLSGRTRSLDSTVRQQADRYGFSDLNSPSASRLNRAAPRARAPNPATLMGTKHFAPGFSADVYSGNATCAPSLSGPTNFRATTSLVGDHAQPFGRAETVPGPVANAVFHGRHRGAT